MPKKATFSDEQYEAIMEAAKRVRKKHKNQETMALALGLTQQSIGALLLGKYKPSLEYAQNIAHADGRTLADLVGEPVEGTGYWASLNAATTLKGLETCVAYHGERWQPWTIAAARAGFFGKDDMDPPVWEKRLDTLEAALAKARAAAAR